jgi:hypothetical protein
MVVGGLFMFFFKMVALFGRVVVLLTMDEIYQHKRMNKFNRTIKSLGNGIVNAFRLLVFSFMYTIWQFYNVPMRNYPRMNMKVLGVFLAIWIVSIFNNSFRF